MLYKPHPFDSFREAEISNFVARLGGAFGNCTAIPSITNMHETIQKSDAIACINSNVGLEAAAYAKPVIAFGEGHYTHKGFTYDLSSLDDLESTLQSLPEKMSESQLQLRDRFLSYILWQYLISVGRPERAVERIEKAIASAVQVRQKSIAKTRH
jgi:capsule polysaccharide export protein KpsC/LpsZ